MQDLPKSQLLRFTEQALHVAQRAVSRYSSKFSKRRYTLHQHIVLLCLKVRKNTTYRTLLDELIEMPRIQDSSCESPEQNVIVTSGGLILVDGDREGIDLYRLYAGSPIRL